MKSEKKTVNKGIYGDVLCCNINGKYWLLYL